MLRILTFSYLLVLTACSQLEQPASIQIIPTETSDNLFKIAKDSIIRVVGGNGWYSGHISTYINNEIKIDTTLDLALLNIQYDRLSNSDWAVGMNGQVFKISSSIVQFPVISNDIHRDILLGEKYNYIIGGKSYKSGHIYTLDKQNDIIKSEKFEHEFQAIENLGNNLIIVGYGIVLMSKDGLTWNKIDVDGDFFTSIAKVNEKEAFITGHNHSIFKTEDGGFTWQKIRNNSNHQINYSKFINDELLLLCNNGVLKKYNTITDSWKTFDLGQNHLFDCTLIDQELLVVGADGYAALITF